MAGSGEARKVPTGLASAHEGRDAGRPSRRGGIREAGCSSEPRPLGARLNALENQLKTRTTVKRQAVRLARLQRRLDQQGGSAAPALASPDGRFAIGLTNEGVRLRGPGPSLVLGAGSLTLSSGAGGSALQLAAARATLSSPQVFLGAG